MKPKQSDVFRDNAQNCAEMAERAKDKAAYKRFKRMEEAWLALAKEQEWLDGEIQPNRSVLTEVLDGKT
ncbi:MULTISPECIES: hypothetical protein [Bradyrhizobium]|jgi:hypothetical protein|uniref:hypothetical protein n=1 Tax=Bradyrhizobium TaxID=374 RepID=UPI000551DA9A|nr:MULTISPECIES: hypothetical protein [Bradyrhizobium]RZN34278.1 hypothetical protein CWO90_07630 [Bradyrhizobium sp. Leo121]